MEKLVWLDLTCIYCIISFNDWLYSAEARPWHGSKFFFFGLNINEIRTALIIYFI